MSTCFLKTEAHKFIFQSNENSIVCWQPEPFGDSIIAKPSIIFRFEYVGGPYFFIKFSTDIRKTYIAVGNDLFLELISKKTIISLYLVQLSVSISSPVNQLYSHLLAATVSQFMNAKKWRHQTLTVLFRPRH